MKTIKKHDMMLSITIVFYICFAVMPFFVSGGYQMEYTLKSMFVVFPTNLLIYIVPAVFYFFIKKIPVTQQDQTKILLICDTVLTALMYLALSSNRNSMLFSCVAIVMLSCVCINTNETVATLILLPGLLLFKLGTEYLFAAYIPVLLLFSIKIPAKKVREKNGQKASSFTLFAYLYIIVLAAILSANGKISFYTTTASHNFSNNTYAVNFITGCILVAAACVLFMIRAIPAMKNMGLFQKTATVLFVLYPVMLFVASCFYNIIFNNIKIVFLLMFIIYITGNIQLSLTYGDDIPGIVPEKLKNSTWAAITIILFCGFCFE